MYKQLLVVIVHKLNNRPTFTPFSLVGKESRRASRGKSEFTKLYPRSTILYTVSIGSGVASVQGCDPDGVAFLLIHTLAVSVNMLPSWRIYSYSFIIKKAAELAKEANYPTNWATSLSGIANTYLALEQFDEAYQTIAPLLVDDILFSFRNRPTLNLAAITYRVLTARQDPRAEEVLERLYAILQEELAKFTDPERRAAFIENDVSIQSIIKWWTAKNGAAAASA